MSQNPFEGRPSHVIEMSCATTARLIRVLSTFAAVVLGDEHPEEYPEEILHLARTAAGLSEVLFDTRHDTVNQIMSLAESNEDEDGFPSDDDGFDISDLPLPRTRGLLN